MRTSTMVKIETAFDGLPEWLVDATKEKLVISVASLDEQGRDLTVTMDDVTRYYAYEAPNFTSGCRTIAGFTGDWRCIDTIAQACLDMFKVLNIKGLRKACKPYSHIMTPKF